ncbi:MAG: CBS domain-containing protein [Methanosarcina flavescens]|jgi:CBS domain-containing protein|uniref:CBS domain-containing protein n=1 Tax=Methanosarcina flavescens TaxID=1715806 RepID=A0A660HRH9_9EURY|nr:CBS domain-containing protein [Methanosarcina flavescens]AYK14854.1 CBS domain-containing protein [Methanosarcina flavescens]NLK33067.1 CBS domain-containing protein [Methanosarcina flavescens]
MPKNIFIEDIMVRDVASATLPGSRDEVLKILKNKHISGVPVLKDSKVVGIVTRTNLLQNPEEEQLALLMTRDPITISPGSDLQTAARLLLKHGIRRLPVVDNGKLVGLVTVADVVGTIADMNIDIPIKDYVEKEVVAIYSETPLPVAARIMELAAVKAVPVLDANLELVGIISDRDIIAASVIEDSVEMSDMSSGLDDDAWTWESMRDTLSIYYSVSRIKVPNLIGRDIMIKEPITATYIASVSDCARKMKRNRIDQIPIINSNRKLQGLLRDHDLLKPLIEME